MPHALSMPNWSATALRAIGGVGVGMEDASVGKAPAVDMFDMLERGVGGGALTTLRRAEKGAGIQQCYVRRERTEGEVAYHMFTETGDYLLSAHTCPKGAGPLDKPNQTDAFVFSQFKESSEHCFATLRLTKEAGKNPSYAINYRRTRYGQGGLTELGCVTHDTVDSTPLYSMRVAVPRCDCPATTTPTRRRKRRASDDEWDDELEGESGTPARVTAEEGSYSLRTRVPRWNEDMQSYTLDYGGRALLASAKNFQLEMSPDRAVAPAPPNPNLKSKGKRGARARAVRAREGLVMQYGKVDPNCFNLDYAYPLCGLQAFAIALSTYEWK